jgi:hypothetical protein
MRLHRRVVRHAPEVDVGRVHAGEQLVVRPDGAVERVVHQHDLVEVREPVAVPLEDVAVGAHVEAGVLPLPDAVGDGLERDAALGRERGVRDDGDLIGVRSQGAQMVGDVLADETVGVVHQEEHRSAHGRDLAHRRESLAPASRVPIALSASG